MAALFVIDIQTELASNPDTEIPHAARIRDAAAKILEVARSLPSQPIYFVQHEDAPGGSLIRGSKMWELVFTPQIGAANETLVAKTTRDAFKSNPSLADGLKQRGIDRIVAFGIQSECCVEATSKGALDEGLGVTLLQGAHSTYDDGNEKAVDIERAVEGRLRALGAEVVPWENAVAGWKAAGRLQ